MNRRSFMQASAAVILTPGLLMPVRKILTLDDGIALTCTGGLSEAALEELVVHLQKAMDAQTGIPLFLRPTVATAYRTIAGAMAVAQPGDRIMVMPWNRR